MLIPLAIMLRTVPIVDDTVSRMSRLDLAESSCVVNVSQGCWFEVCCELVIVI